MSQEDPEVKNVIMEIKNCIQCHKEVLLKVNSNKCMMCMQESLYTVLVKPCIKCHKVSAFI